MNKVERYKAFIDYFSVAMPEADTELHFNSPFELLVAVILSAQCTDKRVNIITPPLFEKYPTAEVLAEATVEDIFSLIRSCSYPNNKAKHLSGMSKMLANDFQSVVPESLDDLQKLPGVGRKTANVIASVIFNKPAMAVDTHVFRVSARMGLTYRAKNPFEAEQQLIKYIPDETIPRAHHWLILHGRYTCLARTPKCASCGAAHFCKQFAADQKKRDAST